MDLKTICVNNLVEIIKKLPPLLKEEVIGKSLKSIREDAEEDVKVSLMKQIKRDAEIVVDDVTSRIVKSHKNGTTWSRPNYTENMDNELYHTCVHISEKFVDKYHQEIVFPQRRFYGIQEEDEDED